MLRLLLTILCLFVLAAMSASAFPSIDFGVKGGVSVADLKGDDGWSAYEDFWDSSADRMVKPGFAGGVAAEIDLGMGLLLTPEVLYVQKGVEADYIERFGSEYTLKVRQDYIEVPVLMRYRFSAQFPFSANVFLGPAVAFGVSSKAEYIPKNPWEDKPHEADIANPASIDVGIAVGCGLDYAVNAVGRLTFDIRYTLGLVDAFEDKSFDEIERGKAPFVVDAEGTGLKVQNSDIRLMIGCLF